MYRSLVSFLLLLLFTSLGAQPGNTLIRGYVNDTNNTPLQLVNVSVRSLPYGDYTNEGGFFQLSIPADNREYILEFSRIGYKDVQVPFTAISDTLEFKISMAHDITELDDIIIRQYTEREAPTLKNIPVKDLNLIPSASNSLEQLIISLPGVNSNNELSSQYRVRGGSFDENLVYVNDVMIYHPVLIKSGQQEGLSFLNPDLIQNVRFSAGGFNASYGDRLSSVLDISYKKPDDFAGSVKAGLLQSSAHIEGVNKSGKISFLAGGRIKTNRFLLQTLDTRGNYDPLFYDLQSITRFKLSETAELSFLGSFSSNTYRFTPSSRRSSFGNFAEAYQLYVLYEGSESDRYNSANLALSLDLNNNQGLTNKFILHYYNSKEEENYDIRGSYSLNLLDKNLGSENFGDSIMNVGIGSWLNHARNLLRMDIYTFNYTGRWEYGTNILSWGTKLSIESANDRISEWEMIDSAGYSIPYSASSLMLNTVIKSDTSILSSKFESFLIDSYTFNIADNRIVFSAGARFSYWSFSDEIMFSPRLSLSWTLPSNRMSYFVSGGVYYQPPFYREMRYTDGKINPAISSQKSLHTVVGADYDFNIGNTPLHLSIQAYYKNLEKLIPYKYDNIRIIYAAENNAHGFVRGLDIRLNGEFVKDAESWISLSFMDARHDIYDDDYGYFPAPSDSRFSINVFFQDYFPANPSYRAHINLYYSTGLPVSSPYTDRYDSYHRMPPYRRVDIGFTRLIKSRNSTTGSGFVSFFDEIIAGIEVFNLLDIRNTISYNWLTTVNNLSGEARQYAVPNYLTGRSLNVKLIATF